jgi:nicotinate-nucleotide adenylyltransferase
MGVKRIGLLGGSFDPVHRAHITLAKAALTHLGLNEVQLIPAHQPWQKDALQASAAQRLHMLDLAIGQQSGLSINPIELDRSGKTYTIETLEQLCPSNQYFWILGSDQLQNFCTWYRWADIAARVTLAVAVRPGATLKTPPALTSRLEQKDAQIVEIPFEAMDISSSDIRQALLESRDTKDWITPEVAKYIFENGLYTKTH